MRAIILGTQSFVDGGTKVGTQYLAQALAGAGWQVDYVPTLSSPVDVVGRQRHGRLLRAWAGGTVRRIQHGLTEWSVKAPFPAHRLFLRFTWQAGVYGSFFPVELRKAHFDVCLADVAPNLLTLRQITARVRICRVNDWPHGFARDLHPVAMKAMEDALRATSGFDEAWVVSRPLLEYVRGLNPGLPALWMPNGVDAQSLASFTGRGVARQARSAVYVGGMTAWLDRTLLQTVARRLPDWRFDIYGPGGAAGTDDPPNLNWRGSVARDALGDVLSRYEVGLVPFCNADGRMRYVERPLKFYEYITAGLGVASTDLGALRQGMGDWACYGNGVEGYARAIEHARLQGAQRSRDVVAAFVREHAWETRAQAMLARLDTLLA